MNSSTLAAVALKKVPISAVRQVRKVGQGGMAEVWEAVDNSADRVALRMLLPCYRFNHAKKHCFVRGVNLRRRLGRHPNVVHYRAEGSSWFRPFEIIEFISGENLKRYIVDKHEMVWKYPLLILRQCAAAMIHVHNCGFIHLDIKPENYFVYTEKGKPVVKLSDFDLCQDVSLTKVPEGFGGSMAYLPPEYLEHHAISLGLDIFAFGVMAYNVYTFQMPFVGSVANEIRNGSYTVRFPAEVEERMPRGAVELIRKCLAPKPADRYANGYELFLALEDLHKQELKRPPSER